MKQFDCLFDSKQMAETESKSRFWRISKVLKNHFKISQKTLLPQTFLFSTFLLSLFTFFSTEVIANKMGFQVI